MGSIAESYKKILSEDAKTEQKNNVKDEYSDKETQDMDEMDAKQGDEEKGSTPDVNDGSPTDSLAKSKRSGVQDKTELSDDSTKIDDSQDHVKDVDKAEDSKGISEKKTKMTMTKLIAMLTVMTKTKMMIRKVSSTLTKRQERYERRYQT